MAAVSVKRSIEDNTKKVRRNLKIKTLISTEKILEMNMDKNERKQWLIQPVEY